MRRTPNTAHRAPNRSFTLIEAIMTITIIGVLAVSAGSFFIPMMNMLFYLPSQISVAQMSHHLVDIIMEGDNQAGGLRYAISITSADEDEIEFVTQDNDTVVYRWDSGDERLYRNINGAGETLAPYTYYGDIIAKGSSSDSQIFRYYDSSASVISAPVATPDNIESIRIGVLIQSGTGNLSDNEGSMEILTGVDIKQY
ncbi:type II secretion system protein [Candidatus Omnitrophota bacterium]